MRTLTRPTEFVGYVRVSTDKQDISPDLQAAEIRRFAKSRGLRLSSIVREEASAKDISGRSELSSLLARAQADRRVGIIVYKLDRVSRRNEDWFGPLNTLAQSGQLDIVTTPVEAGNADNEAFLGMQSIFSHLERRKISDRTKEALRFKVSSGGATGHPPYGFEFHGARGHRELRPLHGEHHWYLLVRYLVFRGFTYGRIADILDALGAPTSKGRGRWHASTCRSIARHRSTGMVDDIERWRGLSVGSPDHAAEKQRLFSELSEAFRRAEYPFVRVERAIKAGLYGTLDTLFSQDERISGTTHRP